MHVNLLPLRMGYCIFFARTHFARNIRFVLISDKKKQLNNWSLIKHLIFIKLINKHWSEFIIIIIVSYFYSLLNEGLSWFFPTTFVLCSLISMYISNKILYFVSSSYILLSPISLLSTWNLFYWPYSLMIICMTS